MTIPTAFFVDINSTITPKAAVSVDPTTGAPSILTVDSSGNPVSTLCGGGGGGGATNWQSYTPNVSNAVHIAIDRSAGPNVMLGAPVDNTQVVDVPLNMADGQEMQINLIGGGGSGSWTTWSSGAPTTPGFVFIQGAAPTAPGASTSYLPVYVKRRGVKYECVLGVTATV